MDRSKNKPDLCIVYDKYTKNQAKSLSNKLAEKNIRCMCLSEKAYQDQEIKSSNFNKVLLFSKALIKENLSLAEESELLPGVTLLHSGCVFGISVDPSVIVENSFVGRNWWKYLLTLIAAGLIGAAVLTTYLLVRDPIKKAETKLFFDAVTYLTTDDNITRILPKQIDF